jgi:crotonobetainyl-CoA:carnitine CoA-transferase CaiB-like acyl-CoA transferase
MTMGEYQMDPLAGLHMAASALVGLMAGGAASVGQYVEGSMMEAGVSFIGEEIMFASAIGRPSRALGNRHLAMAPQGLFPCAGPDAWVAVTVRDDSDWVALAATINDSRLKNRAYATASGRNRAADEIEGVISDWTRPRRAREVMTLLQDAGVPAGVVQGTDEALADPHFRARGWFHTLDHADVGRRLYNGFPWSFSDVALSPGLAPPRLGEHSGEILRDILQQNDEQIGALFDSGVTGTVLTSNDGPESSRVWPRQRG